jgi:hypothetical protein
LFFILANHLVWTVNDFRQSNTTNVDVG